MQFSVETSAFSDAVQKASQVAPSKGHAFDAAAGIIIECDESNATRPIAIKATDLESTFLTVLPAVDVVGSGVWRLPADVLAKFVGQLPMGQGQSMRLETADDDDGLVVLSAGRTTARLRTISPESFPQFVGFDASEMSRVDHFAQRVQQVAWSTVSDEEVSPLAGVHVDGTHLNSCNRVTTARVPCVVPVEEPITVPLRVLAGVMRNTGEVQMRADERRLYLMTDQDTQASTVIFEGQYPDLSRIWATVATYEMHCRVDPQALIAVLSRMMVLCKSERYPEVLLTIGRGALSVVMDVPDLGRIDDGIDVGEADHDAFEIAMSPTVLTQALSVTKSPWVDLRYIDRLKPVHLDDGSGYECIAMPRRS